MHLPQLHLLLVLQALRSAVGVPAPGLEKALPDVSRTTAKTAAPNLNATPPASSSK
jgi:hypothetical protein